MSEQAMYVIVWKSLATGYSNRGTLPLSEADADEWVEKLNRAHPELNHWKEAVR